MRNMLRALAAGIVLAGVSSLATAALVPIVNPSFESQPLGNGGYVANNVTGWTIEDPVNNGVWLYNPGGETPGGNVTDGNNAFLPWGYLGIYQTLAATVQANTHYTYMVDVYVGGQGGPGVYGGNEIAIVFGGTKGIISYDKGARDAYGVYTAGDESAGFVFGGPDVQNLANTSPAGSGILNMAASPTGGNWYTLKLEWDVPAGSAMAGESMTLFLRRANTNANWTLMDNVRLDATAIPEPASLSLLALGSLALRRRSSR